MLATIMYEHIEYGGYTYSVNEGENIPAIPPPMGSGKGQASSMRIYSSQWMTFWESPNYDEHDDSLWVYPPKPGYMWTLNDLRKLPRPHGTNNWNDRIRCVSFSGPPTGSNENRTIIHADGRIQVGNRLFTLDEAASELEITLEQVSLNSDLVPANASTE